MRDHFGSYGDIESINVKTDPNTGRSRGFAFIVFAKAESLDKVIIITLIHLKFVNSKNRFVDSRYLENYGRWGSMIRTFFVDRDKIHQNGPYQ